MAEIDCTLDGFMFPGLPLYEPLFGTKKDDGRGLTTEECCGVTAMPFARQRPFDVPEDSETGAIEAHSSFLLKEAGVSLELGDASFEGCVVRVINESAGRASASGAGFAATLAAGRFVSLVWRGGGWAVESGDGYIDESGVFHVRSAQGLKAWAAYMEETADWSVSCALDACVDMAGEEWLPVGTEENPYTGRFDGGGHSIRNLTIDTSEYQNTGFIGYMSGDAEVRNLALAGCSVALTWSQSTTARAGGIAGYMASGAVTGCQVSGTVSATSSSSGARAGGIAGIMAAGAITGCQVSGTVSATSSSSGARAGGMVGQMASGAVTGCQVSGSVSAAGAAGTPNVGGIAGSDDSGCAITRCENGAAVSCSKSGEYSCVGGIVGGHSSGAVVAWCVNKGSVSGTRAGGIAGNWYSATGYSAIACCVNMGSVSGSTYSGYMAGNRSYSGYAVCQYNTRVAGPTSECGRSSTTG